jgi:hypothetical protein
VTEFSRSHSRSVRVWGEVFKMDLETWKVIPSSEGHNTLMGELWQTNQA